MDIVGVVVASNVGNAVIGIILAMLKIGIGSEIGAVGTGWIKIVGTMVNITTSSRNVMVQHVVVILMILVVLVVLMVLAFLVLVVAVVMMIAYVRTIVKINLIKITFLNLDTTLRIV